MLMVIKLVRLVTYEGLPLIKSRDPLITLSCEISWKTKNISTIRVLMATKPGRMLTYLDRLLPIKTWCFTRGRARSRDMSSLYINFHRACGHQTWQDDNLPWWDPTCKVTYPLITLPCKTTCPTKTIISAIPQFLWTRNFAGWSTCLV